MSVALNLSGLRTMSEGTNEAINRGVARAAHLMAELAAQLAPVDTGALRDSIHAEPGDGVNQWRVVAGVSYAVWVEYGNQYSPAQPFLTPAMRAIDVDLEIKRELQALIARSRV